MSGFDGNLQKIAITPRRRNDGGFTIIELMIALGIGALLMAGAVQMFRANRIAFTLQDQIKSLEENGRVALDFMSRDMRTAGGGGQQGQPLVSFDNANAASAAVLAARSAKSGTDMLEVFTSSCPEPILIPSFNENAADVPSVPQTALAGCMDCYVMPLTSAALDACLVGFNVMITDANPPASTAAYTCRHQVTNSNIQGGTNSVNLNFNNGADTDLANRPHQCNNPDQASNNWDAYITIGADVYYYVAASPTDATNYQLMRYRVGSAPEAVANYVEDFQVSYGDNSGAWTNDAPAAVTGNISNVRQVRISLLLKSKNADPTIHAAPTALENSAISNLGVADNYRRRIITRTIRLRNLDNGDF